jgi:hypothetical protein
MSVQSFRVHTANTSFGIKRPVTTNRVTTVIVSSTICYLSIHLLFISYGKVE